MITMTFHEFTMGDVEDPDIYVAQPIYEWQQTAKGQWVMDHASDLQYYTAPDPYSFGYKVTIRGTIEEKTATEFCLKWK
jgi:hypothetical protein